MAVAVIADAHLGGPGGAAGPLVEQLDSLAVPRCERLLLLGDLFHVWVALPSFETSEVRQVAEALDRVRAKGIHVDYVEGNRDFFVVGSRYESHFDFVGNEVAFKTGDKRFLAVHGDGLDNLDYQYRFWRFLSKNRMSRLAARALPAVLARWFVYGTESRLARTNFKHKTEIPEQAITTYGDRRLAEGHEVLLLGHFHEPQRWTREAGEVWLLDAWFRTREIEWLGERREV
ncbi:MAG: metallophosphoesterase family protein [Acidobacteriota bacterium]|nr:metallophosphoesterase family protein [Acidobacteriota bacterium]